MLSLSPRYDLFRFQFPKSFLSERIQEQIGLVITRHNGVMTDPIQYLNESVVSVSVPGIDGLTVTQPDTWFGTEPYKISAKNPLNCIDKQFTVTFRMNQGLWNFFMFFEAIIAKHNVEPITYKDDVFMLQLLNETGEVCMVVKFFDCVIKGLDKINLSFNKVERQAEQFSVSFAFNNIDIDFAYDLENTHKVFI